MKRSEINACIREFEAVLRKHCFMLPPFLSFTPEEWQTKGSEYDEIWDNALGWDLTDFGSGDFFSRGLYLITLRNGNPHRDDSPKPYAEKIMMLRGGQTCPCHFHWHKMEDIINRAGGTVLIRVYNSLPDESIDRESPVTVHSDGRELTVPAGTQIPLKPGQSITITPLLYHDFTVAPGTGPVLLGEVSQVNDDVSDNRFDQPMGRFPTVEEDEPPYRLLCNEYPPAPDNTPAPAADEKG